MWQSNFIAEHLQVAFHPTKSQLQMQGEIRGCGAVYQESFILLAVRILLRAERRSILRIRA
jgi:hypothetical protein